MIVNIAGVWDHVAGRHSPYVQHHIDQLFKDFHQHSVRPHQQCEIDAVRFIQRYQHFLIDDHRTDFSDVLYMFDRRFPRESREREIANAMFCKAFDYATFSKKSTLGWNAYSLCRGAKWTVCPYCHIHGTETEVQTDDFKGYRPQIDHYYPKSEYPFLALSLGNLIPSCAQCNGQGFKHQTDFYEKQHLHPFIDQQKIQFELVPANPLEAGDIMIETFRAHLDCYAIHLRDPNGSPEAERSLKTFQLESRYKPYLGEAWRVENSVKSNAERNNAIYAGIAEIPDPASRALMIKKALGLEIDLTQCLSFQGKANLNTPTGKMQHDIYSKALEKWCN
jgi:hypothetical protein